MPGFFGEYNYNYIVIGFRNQQTYTNITFGGFLKSGYPQIINFGRIFHSKPSSDFSGYQETGRSPSWGPHIGAPDQEIHQAARSKVLFASRCRFRAPKMAVEVQGVGGSGVEVLERAQKLMKTRTWLCLWKPLVMTNSLRTGN